MSRVVGILLPLPFDKPFDYLADDDIKVGQLVEVPFGSGKQIGMVYQLEGSSDLLIQKIRFGDQFSYSINVEETLYKYYVIKLILQPIVENAIEHGLDEYSNNGKIEIDGKEDEEFIILSIKDNGFGISEEKLKEIDDSFHDKNIHKGVGLQNVYQRIKIYYGEKADIKINSVIDEGTTIFIYIPKRKALNNDEDKV